MAGEGTWMQRGWEGPHSESQVINGHLQFVSALQERWIQLVLWGPLAPVAPEDEEQTGREDSSFSSDAHRTYRHITFTGPTQLYG